MAHVVFLGEQAAVMEIGDQAETRAPSAAGISDQRYWAGVVDLAVLPLVLGMGAMAVVNGARDAQAIGALVAFAVLSASEAAFGRTPGKAMMQLETRRVDGGLVGWRGAAIRRSWMGLYGLGLIPGLPSGIGALLFATAFVSVVVSTGRAADGRGWHDRLAGTEVVSTRARRRIR